MLKVERSPAKVCWHVLYDGLLIETGDTKKEAESLAKELSAKYGVPYESVKH